MPGVLLSRRAGGAVVVVATSDEIECSSFGPGRYFHLQRFSLAPAFCELSDGLEGGS